MAYADIGDVSDGGTIETIWGDQVRANFQAGVPDIFAAEGDLAIATGADAAVALTVGAADSTLVAGAARPEWQIQPAVRVYNSAAIDPAPGGWVALTFDSERFDTDAAHSVAANTHRLTVPANGGGIYSIGANISVGSAGTCSIRVLLNGVTIIAQASHYYDSGNPPARVDLNLSTIYSLAATDFVEVQVYVVNNVNVLQDANYSPEFWMIWQRRQ